jgi:hypothetical protein
MNRAILRTAAIDADAATFDAYVAALRTAREVGERIEIFNALGRVRDPVLLRRAFALVLDPAHDAREASEVFDGASNEASNAPALLAFVRENLVAISARLPEESVNRMPRLHRQLCSPADRTALQALYAPRPGRLMAGARHLAQTLEHVDICVRSAQRVAMR